MDKTVFNITFIAFIIFCIIPIVMLDKILDTNVNQLKPLGIKIKYREDIR